MLRIPVSSTDITELVLALTGHMVASFNLLYNHFASLALPKLKIFDEELELVFVADRFMFRQQTVCTKHSPAFSADHCFLFKEFYKALACLLGA